MANSKIYNGVTIYGTLDIDGKFVFPTTDGSNGQALVTDGGGNVTWQTVSGGTGGGSGSTYSSIDTYVSGVTKTITHSLNSTSVIVQLIDTGANELIEGYVDNYQLNSVDVTLDSSLSDIKTVVAGGIFVGVSGATGSTSPGGGSGDIQFNDGGGGFAGSSDFNYDIGAYNLSYTSDDGTQSFETVFGNPEWQSQNYRGGSMIYNNSLSGVSATTFIHMGDTSNIIGTDNGLVLGFIDWSANTNSVLFTKPDSITNQVTFSGGSMMTRLDDEGYDAFITSAATFNVKGDTTALSIDYDGNVSINSQYTFPTSDGGNGQVMQTDGGGNLSWASVSGGSGSPGGSDGDVQFNNGTGGFDGSSDFNWNSGDGILNIVSSAGTGVNTFSVGSMVIAPMIDVSGMTSNIYENPLSGGSLHTIFGQGDLSGIGMGDNSTFIGNVSLMGDETATIGLSQSNVQLRHNDGTYGNNNTTIHLANGIQMELPDTSGNTQFDLINSNQDQLIRIRSCGDITFNNSYTFPNSDGSNGQVMQTDGGGNLTWQSVSGGGGTSIIIEGAGSGSTMRDNNNNTSDGTYSSALGGCANTASGDYSVIAGGGGSFGFGNVASAQNSTVGGGRCNNASAAVTTIAGGDSNQASGLYSTVGGGYGNIATGSSSTISGGYGNRTTGNRSTASGGYCNLASGNHSTIAGGNYNCAIGQYSFIGGGWENTASGYYSVIAGGGGMGAGNTASATRSTIGGGFANTASGSYSTVAGGRTNSACGNWSTIGGGNGNTASVYHSTVGGGYNNTASGYYSVVAGGNGNTASGSCSTIVGGQDNIAGGAKAAIVGGLNNTASGDYSFVGNGNNNTDSGYSCAMIVGSNITADRACATFVNNLSVKNIPTSAAGLPSGSVWSSGGTLMII